MIVELSKSKLSDVFNYISKTVSIDKNAADVSYKGIQFLFKNSDLYLYTCDGSYFCRAYYGSVQMENFSFAVEYNHINKLVILAKEETISIDIQESGITLKDGKSKYKMQYMSLTDFSHTFSSIDATKTKIFTFKSGEFNKVLSFLKQSLPTQEDFKSIKGIYFDGSFVVTNMTSIAINLYTDKIDNPLFLSVESFKIISKLLQEKDVEVTLSTYKSGLIAESGNGTYILRCLAEKFPNYLSKLDAVNKHSHKVVIKTTDLSIACKKLISFTDSDRSNFGRLTFYSDKLVIAASTENRVGEEIIDIDTDTISQELSFSANLNRLAMLISQIKNDTITITFSELLKEYVIRSNESIYIEATLYYK